MAGLEQLPLRLLGLQLLSCPPVPLSPCRARLTSPPPLPQAQAACSLPTPPAHHALPREGFYSGGQAGSPHWVDD